jgi:hypothetical protein
MFRTMSTGGRRWLGVPLLALTMMLTLVGPAAAATTLEGSGTGTGFSDINETGSAGTGIPCLRVSSATYNITVPEGAVAAQDTTKADPTAAYVGPLTVRIRMGVHRISPLGTFADSSTCVGPPNAITADITVTSVPTGSVTNCTSGGQWTRVDTVVTFVGNGVGTCTVNGNVDPGSIAVTGVRHNFEGNEYPCFVDPVTMVSTCPNSTVENNNVQGTWTAAAANIP